MTALASAPVRPAAPAGDGRPQRSRGRVGIGFAAAPTGTRIERLYQEGCGKARLPGYRRRSAGEGAEAVLLNTAGGLTGGDRFEVEVSVGAAGDALITTQAAERIYRSAGGAAVVESRLRAAPGARLVWLPQETILFDRSVLARRIEADLAGDAILLATESAVLGRAAMGERVRTVAFFEQWRVRRDGRLIFADGARLAGDAEAILAGRATGGGARAFATVLLAAPDAAARLDAVRAALAGFGGEAGASTWNGLLVARLLASDGRTLRSGLIRAVETLRGAPMPRVWTC